MYENLNLEFQELITLRNLLIQQVDPEFNSIYGKVLKALGYPLPLALDDSAENVAKLLIKEINADSGICQEIYTPEWVKAISDAVVKFFSKSPHLLTEENLIIIAIGEEEEQESILLENAHGQELSEVLNAYFDCI